jgi:Fic family protein
MTVSSSFGPVRDRVTPSGKWLKAPEGYLAFHPHPLPPVLEWSQPLVLALSNASALLGQLAGEGRRLPNPHVLIRPFIRREAVFSSRIEGTQSTLGELLAAEAGALVERSPDDLREVGNYVSALEQGVRQVKKNALSLGLVRQLHKTLMTGVRGQHARPGEFRKVQNWIGRAGDTLAQASFVPPTPKTLKKHLKDWEMFLQDRMLPPLIHSALAHYQFETIHPFLDGNGRVGRLLITLGLCEGEVLPQPLLYLSAFFEATRAEYYRSLYAVSEQGDWTGWLQYYLNGVARQAEDALSRSERINALLVSWRERFGGEAGARVALQLVQRLGANPYLTPRSTQKLLKLAYNTVMRAIGQLEEEGILIEVSGGKRDRVYCAQALLKILEEPARLVPLQAM